MHPPSVTSALELLAQIRAEVAASGSSGELPFEQWPAYWKAVAEHRDQSDAGVGDTVMRVVVPEAGETFHAAFQRAFGFDCGCNRAASDFASYRQALNAQYRYDSQPVPPV